MKKSRRGVGAGALVAVLAILAGQSSAPAAEPQRVTKPVQATKFDLSPGRSYLPLHMAVDPQNQLNVAAAFGEVRTKRCGLLASTDGGQTWVKREVSPSPASYPYCLMGNSHTFQGKVAWGRDGTLYYVLAGWDVQDGGERSGNVSVFVARSRDFGESWTAAPVADARGRQGEQVNTNRPISSFAVDATSGSQDILYVGWRRQFPGEAAPNARANEATVAVSTDGGATFGASVDLSSTVWDDRTKLQNALQTTPTTAAPAPGATTTTVPAGSRAANPSDRANFGGSNPTIAVDDKGTAYVAWVTRYANLTPSPLTAHFLSKSVDRGKTWTTTSITPFIRENVNNFGSMILQWTDEGGPDGTLHMVYEASTKPDVVNETDINYRRSTDGGKTWSEPRILNDDDPSQLYVQAWPNLNAAPNGRLEAAWFDTRNDAGRGANDVYLTVSEDNGATWSQNLRISDRSINRLIGPFAGNFDLNAPPGLAASSAYTLVSWDDTRFGDANTETQDAFVSALQYRAVGGESRASIYALSAVIGVVAVGLLLLAVSLTRMRRGPTPPPPRRAGVPDSREAAGIG